MQNLLNTLNEKQQEAVVNTEGPILILAGAGSGKTTVLVNRIAYMISEQRVNPYNILAITFTNKAANEMKSRIEAKIGDLSQSMWVGTFHSICVRILRVYIDLLGYERNFVIYDTADSKTVMKECLKELNLDEKNFPVRSVLSNISSAKDDLMDPVTYESVYKSDFRKAVIAKVYKLYQQKLKKNNALDFDDIVLNTVKILSENPDVLMKYQNRFQYIMVDEYQDTNNVQYMLISLLAGGYRNLCVVGDDDQSIYKFRGANIRNILDFEKEFPDARVIKLEQNYRSTQNILDAANTVIANNRGRKGKELWTENGCGDKIKVYTGSNEYDEGRYIAKTISDHVKEGGKYSNCAILYRTNAQSRVVEEMLMREAVPYRVLAGLRFYDRKEIKDIVAYLRTVLNPNDDVSLTRIINEPKRGIGGTTIAKAQEAANKEDTSIYAVISRANDYPSLARAAGKLMEFAKLIADLSKSAQAMKLSEFVTKVLADSGYMTMLQLENTVEAQTRIDNLNEFMSVVVEYENGAESDHDLAGFLESVSLISDIDSYDEDQDAAVLMTIHSAKGLEFPIVFLSGLEEGLFPGMRSMNSEEDIEEERRLCYVAITRAKQTLHITKTEQRTLYGKTMPSMASRFFKEIPPVFLEETASARAKAAGVMKAAGIGYQPQDQRRKEIYIKPKQEEPLPEAVQFKPGDFVEHRKFGRGEIISVQQFGKDAKLEIHFESVGVKHLMAVFAKLKKVD